MIIREYTEADYAQIKELHSASGFGYSLPSLSSESFFSRRIIGDDKSVAMAAFLKLSAETYLIADPQWRTPAWRMEALRQLQVVSASDAQQAGAHEMNAFLPPQIGKSFGRRLNKMGWTNYHGEEWRCYSLRVR